MTGPPSPAASEIVAAARALASEEGLRGLSLRKVASRAGLSLGGVSYQVGGKGDLVRLLLHETAARQRARHAGWLVRAARLDLADPAVLAGFLGAWLDEAAAGARDHAIAMCELLLDAARDPAGHGEAADMIAAETAFWRKALREQPDGADLAQAIADYTRDELPFTLALGGDPDYRLLRAAVAARLAARLRGDPGRGFAAGFEALVSAMSADALDVVTPRRADPASRRAQLAAAAAQVIAEEGIAAVTHRAVAAAAGAPNSTVAHHFRTRDDLLRAGMEALYLDVARAVSPGEGEQARRGGAILRATHAMALAAARDASLAPFALDLRRRRGEHIREQTARGLGPPAPVDGAAVQAAAMAVTGAGLARHALGLAEAPNPDPPLARLARLRAGSPA